MLSNRVFSARIAEEPIAPPSKEVYTMRGVHSAVDDIRRNVFTEVARLAYEGGDYKKADMIP